jgi:hypothetical protein
MDTISALESLSGLVITLAGRLGKIRGMPKERLARDLVLVFNMFDLIEKDASAVENHLKEFLDEPNIGMQVHHVHKVGPHLVELKDNCDAFIKWINAHPKLTTLLDIFAPDAKSSLSGTLALEKDVFLETHLSADFWSDLSIELQAIKSPNPKLFPKSAYVRKIIKELEKLISEINKTKDQIRTFAHSQLTIDDFFV